MMAPKVSETYTRTKLHRPPLPGDYVHRPRLLELLECYPQRALTLVCASAGYGKSTILSHWLKSCSCSTAWVSLDEEDNNPASFLAYFLAAIRGIAPSTLEETWALLQTMELPPLPVLVRTPVNELDRIRDPFILAIDDYHLIHDRSVHNLLAGLLKHPVPQMHLALATRHDPPLPLTSLRARGRMTEIRAEDLRFSASEIAVFFRQSLKTPINDALAEMLEEKTEGWVTGLRLSALSLQRGGNPQRMARRLQENRYVMDYLVSEVLAMQPPVLQDFLLTTSILKRFCAPLCDTLCLPDTEGRGCVMTGREFITAVENANLFITPLDDEQQWYRYHQLFQQLLGRQLSQRFAPDDVAELHNRAGRWLAQNGEPEEARRHFLAAGNVTAASELVAVHHLYTSADQQPRLPPPPLQNPRPRLSLPEGARFDPPREAVFTRNTSEVSRTPMPPDHPRKAAGDTWLQKPLTARELEILEHMLTGLKNKEIAVRLFISPETVKRHAANIYKKFGTNGRQQTLNKAIRMGILNHR